MSQREPTEALACLIVAHNLGDAVLQSSFLKSLVARGYAGSYLVWVRPQAAFLFEDIAGCRIVCSQFPVGTNKQFGGRAILQFLKAAWRIRRLRPSVTIDLIGDVRDRWFARVAGSRKHLHLGWAQNHPFTRLIRNPFGTGTPAVTVPAHISNVYEAHKLLLDSLVPMTYDSPQSKLRTHSALPTKALQIGLHPFASQKCKLWPDQNWRDLVTNLLEGDGRNITAFAAPNEREALERLFRQFGDRITLVTATLSDFARRVSELDVLVGLDSFSVHMAQKQGVHSILINAGNPESLWATPDGRTLSNSGACKHYPCFNIPKCEGTQYEYACVKAIRVDDVVRAVRH